MKLGQKLVYAAFVALLITTFVVSHPIRGHTADAAIGGESPEAASTGSLLLKHLLQLVDEVLILAN